MIVFKIALRNLVRQYRRNILLGLGIAIGMSVLVVALSFSHGLSDILLNKIVINVAGHININAIEKNGRELNIIRDKDRFIKIINENVKGVKEIRESVSLGMTRAIGNSKTTNLMVLGVPGLESNYFKDKTVISGNIDDFGKVGTENPIVIYKKTAQDLGVKVNDSIRVKFSTIYGQQQTGHFLVVAILATTSMFEDMVAFTQIEKIKALRDIKPYESGSLVLVMDKLNNPAAVISKTDKLYEALKPHPEGYKGFSRNRALLDVYSFKNDKESFGKLVEALKIDKSISIDELLTEQGSIIVTSAIAGKFKVKIGDNFSLSYTTKESKDAVEKSYIIKAIMEPGSGLTDQTVLIHEYRYYENKHDAQPLDLLLLERNNPLSAYLTPEWTLMERSRTSEELMEKMRDLGDKPWHGTMLNVVTMYEGASGIIDMERAIDLVAVVVIVIIFFIILIGVMNTLRMTIRERTREIGTVRAIGMQAKTVQLSFVLEVMLLTFIACIVGLILAFIMMAGLGSITINIGDDNPLGMFLVKNHLYFVPELETILLSFIIIAFIAYLVALFPSRKAAKMKVADALGHFE